MADLQRLFQQRHLLAHREGLVDADYLAKSGDATYAVGQRLIVREATVLRLTELIEKLVAGLRPDLAGAAGLSQPVSAVASGGQSLPVTPVALGAALPKIVGLTDSDRLVFQLACEEALASGDADVNGLLLWDKVEAAGVGREAFDEATEMLTSKHLFSAAWPIGSGALPALVTISLRGCDLYLRHILPNYAAIRQQIACEIVDGNTTSGKIQGAVAQPRLVVDHIVSDFADRGWVDMRRVGRELYETDPTVELKRHCRE